MCGICGMLALDGGVVDERAVRAMAGALVHRGPDSEGVFAEGPVGLAARRLAIIDLARGDQPMRNEDGSVTVVQNGELYEHRLVQAELEGRGHRFTSHCDTEVLPHLYEERGLEFVDGVRGMFAVALWDSRERRLLLARDPFGIKPLYYRVAGGVLSFASELKALARQPGFSGEIDPEALEAYLAFNSVPAPLSIYREARKLPAGHVLEARDGEVRVFRYARPAPVDAEAVRRYGTDHHELVLRPDAAELLPAIVDAFDEPFADSSALPTYAVSQLAAGHVKVALSGEGGDELFGGYFTYVADLLAPRIGRAATLARPLVEALPSSSRRVSLDYKAKRFVRAAGLPALERHHGWKEIFAPDVRAELLARARTGFDPVDLYRERYAE